jgi:hypothetical protein
MPKSNISNILTKSLGFLLIIMGTTLLFIKIIRDYIIFLVPYSFELFLLSPILIILGLNIICKNIKVKFIKIGTRLLFGMAMIYLIILSASWFSIHKL